MPVVVIVKGTIMAINIHIVYDPEDQALYDELTKQLASLVRSMLINDQFDNYRVPGIRWQEKAIYQLNIAQIILLLISPDFITSKFCYDIQMNLALERHKAEQACVIPIILKPIAWQGLPFARLQPLPSDGRAVTSWPDKNEAYVDIMHGIKKAMHDFQVGPSISRIDKTTRQPEDSYKQRVSSTPRQSQPAQPVVRNHIGSVKGQGHTIIQTGTHNSTVKHRYNTSESDASLAHFKLIVNKLKTQIEKNAIFSENRLISNPRDINQDLLLLFISTMHKLKQQNVKLPRPLLADARLICQQLHIYAPI